MCAFLNIYKYTNLTLLLKSTKAPICSACILYAYIVVCGLVLLLPLLLLYRVCVASIHVAMYTYYYIIITTITSPASSLIHTSPPTLKFILLGYCNIVDEKRNRKKSFTPSLPHCILYEFRWFLSALVTISIHYTSCTTQ